MKKRISTLLAAALVAGGSFSAFAEGGTEAQLKESLQKYYQLKVAAQTKADASSYLVIGQGEARDSLAVWTDKEISSIEDLNETLWRVTFTPVKDKDGIISEYQMRLFNKVGNRQLIVSTTGVEAGKTFYKSPCGDKSTKIC